MSSTRRLAGVAAVVAVVVIVVLAASCCEAREFYVGGGDGWTTNPAEPYNRWTERNRFQVNDRLVFRYSKEKDAVLLVSESHYDACNATDPMLRDGGGGDSTFVFDRSGPFFFISGDPARCQAGERLIVVVLAVRNNNTTSSPPPPASSPKVPAPTPRSLPSPAAGTNGTAPSTSPPVPAPAPGTLPSPAAGGNFTPPAPGTNGTSSSPPPPPPPRPSSASSLRGGALLMLFIVIAGAISS